MSNGRAPYRARTERRRGTVVDSDESWVSDPGDPSVDAADLAPPPPDPGRGHAGAFACPSSSSIAAPAQCNWANRLGFAAPRIEIVASMQWSAPLFVADTNPAAASGISWGSCILDSMSLLCSVIVARRLLRLRRSRKRQLVRWLRRLSSRALRGVMTPRHRGVFRNAVTLASNNPPRVSETIVAAPGCVAGASIASASTLRSAQQTTIDAAASRFS
ncbi:hypothetical protein HPB50_004694 [Hyalomma asiaticum]|uniref:Uncharacterized protein n=1 Tax=Hyalomma asiaticum TaxID=266040 RepID=A0ACB7SYY3_HYAAI|nr:hypothetical protein HPB50_004694 [Hyalomma asiaticum]